MEKLNETDKAIIVLGIQCLNEYDYANHLQTIKEIYKKLEITK